MCEVRATNDIHDDVHTHTSRDLEYFFGPIGVLAIVDQMSGSELASQLQLLIRRGSGNYSRAGCGRNLANCECTVVEIRVLVRLT